VYRTGQWIDEALQAILEANQPRDLITTNMSEDPGLRALLY